ncbi:MAG: hypothetical protein NVSMB49_26850 [Ktedonobacteraceae bacterium]
MHDTPLAVLPQPDVAQTRILFETLLTELEPALTPFDPDRDAPRRRGRPRDLCWSHLWLALVMCTLQGMHSYADLWRLLATRSVGRFAALFLCSPAIIRRLERGGLLPLYALNTRLGELLAQRLPLPSACTLAPFATHIVAFDETTLDVVHKHLPALRTLPKGDPGLLAGKVAALFDLRTQQWLRIQFRPDVLAHCSIAALSVLNELTEGTLLLFDLGYFAFVFFDALTDRKLWWVTRLRSNVTYQLAHTHYRHEGTLDALVWLGSKRSSQTGHMVRLVRSWDGTHLHSYLTNVLDPRLLPLADVVRLYARRWDIELAFLTIKQYLGLKSLWSGKESLILQQLWVVLLLASLYQRLRLHLAGQLGLDPFEVSLPLLLKYLPTMLEHGDDPLSWLRRFGRRLLLIRPSSRCVILVPDIPEDQLVLPPDDLVLIRLAKVVLSKPRTARKKALANSLLAP